MDFIIENKFRYFIIKITKRKNIFIKTDFK